MSITDGTILRVVVSCLWTDGNLVQNIFNAVVTGGGAPWDPEDIVADALTWADDMYANLTTFITNEMDGSQVQVYEYDPVDDDWDEVGSESFTWNPSQVGEFLPRGVAALLNVKSTDPDVSGKKYMAGICDTHLEEGLWTSTVLAGLLAFGIDWYTGFTGGTSGATWTPGIWSVVGTVLKAMVSTLIIPTIPAYQRRRKRGIGA